LKPDNNNMRAGTETEAFERLSANAAKHFINRAYRAAEKALRESLRIKRGWGQGHYLLALIHKKRGQPTAIILRELKAAIAFDSTLAEAYNDIGFIHFQQKRFRKAGLLFERALAASPAANYKRNRARFHYNLGLALHEQRKTAQALKAFEQAVEADRMLGEAWYYVAWLADLQGNQLLARRALSRIEALYPSSSKYHAWAKYKLSR
ncbi:MAG: tetratricopeptide repeat protein, partial [Kofleriaceae bacterium]|nr:tetratricopeptide repeat protein [Kofleriaceae bacterium]